MEKRISVALAAAMVLPVLLTGCTTLSGGATGALAGGLMGAGIGAIAGDPTAGALLGTGVGLGLGTAIGAENERIARSQGWVYTDPWGTAGYRAYPPPAPRPVVTCAAPVAYQPIVHPVYTPCPPPHPCVVWPGGSVHFGFNYWD